MVQSHLYLYHFALMKYTTDIICGSASCNQTSSVSVEIQVLSFCFQDILSTTPQKNINIDTVCPWQLPLVA